MLKHVIILWLLLMGFNLQIGAQNTISYDYDQAGNRVSRTIILGQQSAKRNTEKTDSVALKETIGERTLKVYPNPTKGALGIEIRGGDIEKEIHLMVYSATGAILYNKVITAGFTSIDMTQHPQGWYILRVLIDNEKKEYKIIKE